MIVTFENKCGEESVIATVNDEHEARKCIKEFLDKRRFKSYYTRGWSPEPGHQVIDFGSHVEFFHIYTSDKPLNKDRKVLFLDYDGVVNTMMWSEDGRHCGYNFPSHNSVNNFQAVQWISEFCIKYKFDIVVTSTWRLDDNYIECLINGGLSPDIKILGCTPSMPHHTRGEEIKAYLDDNLDISQYIIVDDEDDFLPDQHPFFVQTNAFYGFGYPDFQKCVNIISKNTQNF